MPWVELVAALWLGLALASAVHELGHALIARLGGARVTALHLGVGPWPIGGRLGGMSWGVHLLVPVGGRCETRGPLRPALAVLERAAGSLTNLGVALGLLAAWPWLAGVVGFGLLLGHLALGLGQLLPIADLDGAALWQAWRRRGQGADVSTSSTRAS